MKTGVEHGGNAARGTKRRKGTRTETREEGGEGWEKEYGLWEGSCLRSDPDTTRHTVGAGQT
eukprot:756792-Hanusia_phi.AAC.6